jgi:hypothetical protein
MKNFKLDCVFLKPLFIIAFLMNSLSELSAQSFTMNLGLMAAGNPASPTGLYRVSETIIKMSGPYEVNGCRIIGMQGSINDLQKCSLLGHNGRYGVNSNGINCSSSTGVMSCTDDIFRSLNPSGISNPNQVATINYNPCTFGSCNIENTEMICPIKCTRGSNYEQIPLDPDISVWPEPYQEEEEETTVGGTSTAGSGTGGTTTAGSTSGGSSTGGSTTGGLDPQYCSSIGMYVGCNGECNSGSGGSTCGIPTSMELL